MSRWMIVSIGMGACCVAAFLPSRSADACFYSDWKQYAAFDWFAGRCPLWTVAYCFHSE